MPVKNQFILYDSTSGRYCLQGEWTTNHLSLIITQIQQLKLATEPLIVIDAATLTAFDTNAALVLCNWVKELNSKNTKIDLLHFKKEHQELYDLVSHRLQSQEPHEIPRPLNLLEKIGEKTWNHLEQGYLLLTFLGEMALVLYSSLLNPKKFRWKMILGHLEETGVYAIPIVGLLSFLLGIVIGYQGGTQLRDYGANIFVVELVSLTMLRELAPMMTAVIVAGRSGSAFTAQIGTMKVTEEINAMQTIGMSPMEVLVLPRILALSIALPLLIVFADIMGVLGGMVMAASMLDVSYYDFFQRLPEAVSLTSFFLGIGKAPVFAIIIAVVGCFQGLQVRGGGESVGKQTTLSVVQSIFILIIADAIFSIIFSALGI